MFSLNQNHIIVNYHHVEDPRADRKGIHPCSIGEFKRQIKFLSANYSIVSLVNVYEAAKDRNRKKLCAITFDDGLKGVYQNAFPVLKEYNATATVFIATSVLDGVVPFIHKVHVLLSLYSPLQLIDLFNTWSKGIVYISKKIPLNNNRMHGDILTNNFKEKIISLDQKVRSDFIDFCFDNFGLNESEMFESWFMNKNEIVELFKSKMDIGSHSHSHNSMILLSVSSIEKELHHSKNILGKLLGVNIITFSYPYGHYNKDTVKVLSERGFKYAVTIQPRPIEHGDNKLTIPRYDTNHLRDFLTNISYTI